MEGDFDHDNDIDGSDLAIFAGDFGRTDCPGEEIYYYHNDHLGTPQKMTDVNGAVVWSADYRPFGQADVTVNTVANNFRFPGQYYDAETGLHFNWHRYYDPATGRYITADPIGLEGGMNLYAYVGGNPVNFIDAEGLAAEGGATNSCCEGYKPYFNSKCENECGELVDDKYPESAYKCCNDFVNKYSGKIYPNTVKKVAKCLTGEEGTCQSKKKCKDREDCRLDAHKKCYWANKFVPVKGIPSSCAAIGGYIF